ncbi:MULTISPECIES: hypothetical protein [Methylobacterium]|jgi:hypothetical protein|uniref:Uncharacterized protein n=1 Tax=Methylobacterium isbiliense TaxID=315478 RepID=A0ABQ4SET6_9HYPH|nr:MULTISPECIES: hypothetical protein [Methylobacterium]MBY0297251.1 hypothetical protein [Methylobacterium sp.]MDN3626326.1 hypothetical protein [Methylobacterium isbiliense]GJE01751.1 hypothetical protein GMJLKIPL_3686 [Methylobacterium isbiliense]
MATKARRRPSWKKHTRRPKPEAKPLTRKIADAAADVAGKARDAIRSTVEKVTG